MFKRIRELREDNDLKQREIGAAINIPQRTYSYYERGERLIPPEILCRLADYYHTSVDYLLERTDETRPYPQKPKKGKKQRTGG